MRLTLKPVEVPFQVGDTVWVNQPYSATHQPPYFQARIIQIILDGSLNNTTVIRQRRDAHELVVSSAVYDLKLVGNQDGLPRITITVSLIPLQPTLFETKQALLDYQNQA